MALKNFYAEEMIAISETWLDVASKANGIIAGKPELSATMPHLKTIHGTLSGAAQPATNPQLTVIVEKEAKHDVRHDTIIRGGFGYLTNTAELIGGDEGTDLIKLRDTLFPDGLQGQLRTYRAEAGAASLLGQRMTPTLRKQTDAILIGVGTAARTLTSYIDELIEIGARLGDLEDERGQIEAETPKGDLHDARLAWVRVAHAMLANAELAQISEDDERILFGPLREEEKKADARQLAKAKAKKAKASSGADAGTSGATQSAGTSGSSGSTGATGA